MLELNDRINACDKCGLALHAYKKVCGKGNLKPRFVLVGEAPGKEEDEKGEPFIGSAGRVLKAIMHEAGMKKSDVYITNVCRCRPPNNRPPTEEEIECCLPYLLEEISLLEPDVVIALGDTAAFALTGYKTKYFRGSLMPGGYARFPVLITSHPAKTFHEREVFQYIVWDFLKVLHPPEVFEKNYIVPENMADAEELLYQAEHAKYVAVDIETTGDDAFDDKGLVPKRDIIIGISLCTAPGNAFHLSAEMMRMCFSSLKKTLENHNGLIFQNNRFDREFLHYYGIDCHCHWDTMTGMYLFNPALPKSLDFLRSIHTFMPPYKHLYWTQHKEIDLPEYNNTDTDVTMRVAQVQAGFVNRMLMEQMMWESDIALSMKKRGILIDRSALATHFLDIEPVVKKIEEDFYSEYGIEISSSHQLSRLLFDTMNLPYPPKAKKKTIISTDEKVLAYIKDSLFGGEEAFPEEFKVVNTIMEYREKSKILSTYCLGLNRAIEEDGRIHPKWNPEGTDTGRWSCGDPNMQNIPEFMKNIVITNGVFLYGDYDRLEIWISALLSHEEEILEMLKNDVDIHNIVREEIAKEYPNVTRTQAKTVVFGTFYGRSADQIAYTFHVPKSVASDWQNMFFNRFPKLKDFFLHQIPNDFEKHGYLTSYFGRVKYPERLTQAKNFPIQSTASDILNRAMIALYKAGFHPVLNSHDACTSEEDDYSRFDEFINIMETCAPELNARFPVGGKVGRTWLECVSK